MLVSETDSLKNFHFHFKVMSVTAVGDKKVVTRSVYSASAKVSIHHHHKYNIISTTIEGSIYIVDNELDRPLLSGLTTRQIEEVTFEELKRINELNVYLSY